jgi:hypothetical protein
MSFEINCDREKSRRFYRPTDEGIDIPVWINEFCPSLLDIQNLQKLLQISESISNGKIAIANADRYFPLLEEIEEASFILKELNGENCSDDGYQPSPQDYKVHKQAFLKNKASIPPFKFIKSII